MNSNIFKKLENIQAYIPGKSKAKNAITQEIIKLSSNENPYGTSARVTDALIEYLKTPQLNIYPDVFGESLVEALRTAHPEIGSAQIVVGNGMDNILECIGRLFLGEGSEVIIPIPTFSYYEMILLWANAQPVFIETHSRQDFVLDIDQLIKVINCNTRLVFLCTPNNPTGGVIRWTDIERILLRARETDTYVFVDEAYIEFAGEGMSVISQVQHHPNLIVGRTFSKVYGLATMRIGWAVIHDTLSTYYKKVQTPFSVSKLALIATITALEDREFIENTIKNNAIGRDYLSIELARLGYRVYPSEANFIAFTGDRPTSDIAEYLLERGIIIRDTSLSFHGEAMLRATIGTQPQNED